MFVFGFRFGVIPHSTAAKANSGGHVCTFGVSVVDPQYPEFYCQFLVHLGLHERYHSRR